MKSQKEQPRVKMKTVIVDTQSFTKNFLTPIHSFTSGTDFVPLWFIDGKVVSFCTSRTELATIGLYIEHTPEACDMDNGEVYYIKSPTILRKAMEIQNTERIGLGFTNEKVCTKGDGRAFSYRLYDPILASRNNTFWDPKKFDKIQSTLKCEINLSKDFLKSMKDISNTCESEKAYIINNGDEGVRFQIGNETEGNMQYASIDPTDTVSEKSVFVKNVYTHLGKNDASLFETENKRILCFREDDGSTVKHYIITKIKE